MNARPENFIAAEEPVGPNGLSVGAPYGLEAGAIMPFQRNSGVSVAYGVSLSVLSVFGSGLSVTVTLSTPYTFTGTYPQVSVLGLTNTLACGFYSVTQLSATVFTYVLANGAAVTGPLLGANTSIVTCNVGLPLGFTTIQPLYGTVTTPTPPVPPTPPPTENTLTTVSGITITTVSGVNIDIIP